MYGLNRSMRRVATRMTIQFRTINLDQYMYVVLPEKHCFVNLLFILGKVFVLEFDPYTGS